MFSGVSAFRFVDFGGLVYVLLLRLPWVRILVGLFLGGFWLDGLVSLGFRFAFCFVVGQGVCRFSVLDLGLVDFVFGFEFVFGCYRLGFCGLCSGLGLYSCVYDLC